MTLKSTLRAMEAAGRRADRAAKRRQREIDRQQKQFEKMQALEAAAYEVERYENYIDVLTSVHKEAIERWDWDAIYAETAPVEPQQRSKHADSAQTDLERYSPNFLDRMLRRGESNRARLTAAVPEAEETDRTEYEAALKRHAADLEDWRDMHNLAEQVRDGDSEAYLEVLEDADPFSDISAIGSSIDFRPLTKSAIEVSIHVNDTTVIPTETASLLKSGKLSTKNMPKSAFHELYQDYVCSCALRIVRDVFALLPCELVVVTAMSELLNKQTGKFEEQPILSIAVPRETLSRLNLDLIDPSDSMDNFVHTMDFTKRNGFRSVEKVNAGELLAPNA